MTQPAISRFFAAIAQDKNAQQALRATGASLSAFVAKAAELAAQRGFALSSQEIVARLTSSKASSERELDLAELDAVEIGRAHV